MGDGTKDRQTERRRLKRKGVIDLTFIEFIMAGTLARHGIHRAAPGQAGAGAQGLHSPAKIHTNTFLMRSAMTDGVVYLTVLLAKTLGGQTIGGHTRISPTLSEVVYRESTPMHCPAESQGARTPETDREDLLRF